MPPQKRQGEVQVEVDPPEAALPRPPRAPQKGVPTKAAVAAAVEKSAEHLQKQAEPPTDVHPKPTTPSKAEVEEAVQRSAEHLEEQGAVPARVVQESPRRAGGDAMPVPSGGTNDAVGSGPVDAGRDKTRDATPVFSSPMSDKPRDE
jgi:hypothetical protein